MQTLIVVRRKRFSSFVHVHIYEFAKTDFEMTDTKVYYDYANLLDFLFENRNANIQFTQDEDD